MHQIKKSAHSVHCLFAHLVFVTKYRKTRPTANILDSVEKLFEENLLKLESKLVEFEGEKDHVHLLIQYPPKHSISSLAHQLKGASSFYIKKEYPHLKKQYWKGSLWTPSYFAGSCGGVTIEAIKNYIANQDSPREVTSPPQAEAWGFLGGDR